MNLTLLATAGTTDNRAVQVQFENVMVLGATPPGPITSQIALQQLDHYPAKFEDGRDPRLTMREHPSRRCPPVPGSVTNTNDDV